MNLKDDEICFLRGHVSQLTQRISQFALKPGGRRDQEKGLVKVPGVTTDGRI